MGRTLFEMVRDRARKRGWYDSPGYWDMKAERYQGLARSNWPSNTYNRHWHERQMSALDRAMGPVEGLRVADVACGTGRASRHLARRGARVTGFDFAPRTLEAARRETAADGLDVQYRMYDVRNPPDRDVAGSFDVVLTISCLAMACQDEASFEQALSHIVAFAKPGGRLVLLEPIHVSRLLRRILKMSVPEWIRRAEVHGLSFVSRRPLGFVPARLALAFRELPDAVVRPVFEGGEWLLDRAPGLLRRTSDYTCLVFRNGHG